MLNARTNHASYVGLCRSQGRWNPCSVERVTGTLIIGVSIREGVHVKDERYVITEAAKMYKNMSCPPLNTRTYQHNNNTTSSTIATPNQTPQYPLDSKQPKQQILSQSRWSASDQVSPTSQLWLLKQVKNTASETSSSQHLARHPRTLQSHKSPPHNSRLRIHWWKSHKQHSHVDHLRHHRWERSRKTKHFNMKLVLSTSPHDKWYASTGLRGNPCDFYDTCEITSE